jgi:heme-degrading monooxygenase HmoA
MIAKTPKPPYYAVIFTSVKKEKLENYHETFEKLMEIVPQQEGFLGFESASSEIGIAISYWKDLESIKKWKANADHKIAQEKGKSDWYKTYKTRIALVQRDYEF